MGRTGGPQYVVPVVIQLGCDVIEQRGLPGSHLPNEDGTPLLDVPVVEGWETIRSFYRGPHEALWASSRGQLLPLLGYFARAFARF
jgi:hypothetical protein